jgi:phage tail sheath protein FI
VPPSVVIAHAIANNDAVASEWFAPAGLNRGGLSMVSGAEKKLRGPERDDLYDARINPIAHFTGQGFSVFGQKTLQGLPSALDRINVRRLLITVKKFIASASRFLVFEQNDVQTRNRFMNIVNPYLESIQQARGLTSFRVVMDDSNNTPDVIDRNRLVGQILLQPTRTAEFIVLDFVVLPTGAAFPE